jgi:rhodanese-related sulfurtransferase
MLIKALFPSAHDLSPDQVRAYISAHAEDQYTLLDVRQPAEYERAHLPGALLIPLPQLSERLGELDRAKPVIVY